MGGEVGEINVFDVVVQWPVQCQPNWLLHCIRFDLPCCSFRYRRRSRNSMRCLVLHLFCMNPARETRSLDIYRFPVVHSRTIGCHEVELPLLKWKNKTKRIEIWYKIKFSLRSLKFGWNMGSLLCNCAILINASSMSVVRQSFYLFVSPNSHGK